MAGFDGVSLGRSVKRFFEVIRIEKKEVSAIYFFAILSGLIQLSLPLGIQAIINFAQAAVGQSKLPASMWLLIVLVVLGVFAAGVLQVGQMRVVEKIQQRIFSRYSLEFTFKIPRFATKETDAFHLPELVNRFFDTVSLQKALSKLLLDVPLAMIQILFGLILLSFYNPVFIVLGLLLLAILSGVLYYTSKPGLAASFRESGYKYDLASWLQELARTFKSFKVGSRDNFHLKKTDEILSGYLEARTEHFYVLKFQYWSLILFKLLITAAMLIIGAILLMDQQLNLGQFIAAEIVIITVLAAVEKLILSLDKAYDVLTSLEKLTNVTDQTLESNGNLEFRKAANGVSIEASGITFGFSEKLKTLQHVDLSIAPGSKVCIMGMLASGKSTLLDLMSGCLLPDEGGLLVNGIPIKNYRLESYRKEIGVFYHDQDIFEGSLLENITMGNPSISIEDIMGLLDIVGLTSYITSLPNGFDTMLNPGGKGLSSLISKKILLARAFAGKPSLLILDEPFEMAAGDHGNRISKYLLGLKNTTVIVATGDTNYARSADQVIYLENGKVKHSGKPDEVEKKLGGK
jgi:ABC-type bacteriocin/lantibiotic exporter with double-glycine peptidase domain